MLKTNTGPELPSQGPCKNICNLMAMVKRPSLCTPEKWHPSLTLDFLKETKRTVWTWPYRTFTSCFQCKRLCCADNGLCRERQCPSADKNSTLIMQCPVCSLKTFFHACAEIQELGQVSKKQLKERTERKRTWVLAGKFTKPESSLFHAQCTEQHGEDPNCTPP